MAAFFLITLPAAGSDKSLLYLSTYWVWEKLAFLLFSYLNDEPKGQKPDCKDCRRAKGRALVGSAGCRLKGHILQLFFAFWLLRTTFFSSRASFSVLRPRVLCCGQRLPDWLAPRWGTLALPGRLALPWHGPALPCRATGPVGQGTD